MGNHPFNVIVILFWLATMSWLVVAKILPPLRVGEPPRQSLTWNEEEDRAIVGWRIHLHDRTIGWAANTSHRRTDGITELTSRVYLDDILALDELLPGWLGSVLKPSISRREHLDLDKITRIELDPLGQPARFESRVRVGPLADALKVVGDIEGVRLKLSVNSGELSYKTETYLPPGAMMADELSPQARMPRLFLGQSWTVPMYSPLRPSTNPVDILQATVERAERVAWGGESSMCHVIVYRNDAGSAGGDESPRGRVWVREDGVVLMEEISIYRSRLRFTRLEPAGSEAIGDELGDDLSRELTARKSKELMGRLDRVAH